jgi:hypothetical protein
LARSGNQLKRGPTRLYDLRYTIKRSDDRSKDVLEKCAAIIKSGRAVDITTDKLRRAAVLVVAEAEGIIAGVGVIKGPRPAYGAAIARKSTFALPSEMSELGYVAISAEHKGKKLSHRMVAELIRDRTDALFATTDDPRMKRTLTTAGFIQQGKEWEGSRGRLSLWIRPASE